MRIILLCLLLQGCAAMDYDWNQPKSPPLAKTLIVETDKTDSICHGLYPTARQNLHGCVKRDYVAGLCVVYVFPHPSADLIHHEKERHCIRGENHL